MIIYLSVKNKIMMPVAHRQLAVGTCEQLRDKLQENVLTHQQNSDCRLCSLYLSENYSIWLQDKLLKVLELSWLTGSCPGFVSVTVYCVTV